MHSINNGDDGLCPLCGREYDKRLSVEPGDRYAGSLPAPLHTLMVRYPSICADPEAAQMAASSPGVEVAVYLHDFTSLQSAEQAP